jgi:glyoxylase-like metal-dependent hydrolase (beta-lactamase superfamily II)/rhodanese-related sulfurtransferase
MLFRQVLNDDLACASYLISCGGEAVVVDPRWDIDEYLRLAAYQGLRIAHVVETHVHADHVSGRGRLAAATGAAVHLPAGCGASDPHRVLRDGDTLRVGQVELTVLATPGHRPEHISLVLTDLARAPRPAAVLTGDSLLVGDVARPDLAVEADAGARDLFASLRRIAALGDDVEVWPAHVGGSLCGGGALSGRTVSTVGQERFANRTFGLEDEDAFVAALTGTLPPRPPNVAHVVSRNRHLAEPPAEPPALSIREFRRLSAEGAVLVDGRPAAAFDAVHVPGAICLPAGRPGVGTRAGWVLASRPPVVTMGRDEREARHLARLLQAVGIDDVVGVLPEGIAGWRGAGLGVASTPVVEVDDLARALDRGEVALVDVRDHDEWDACHVGGALHLPLSTITTAALGALDPRRPVVVACATGVRSAVAASLIARLGHPDVRRVARGGVPELAAMRP